MRARNLFWWIFLRFLADCNIFSFIIFCSLYYPYFIITTKLLIMTFTRKVLAIFLINNSILWIIIKWHYRMYNLLWFFWFEARCLCNIFVIARGSNWALFYQIVIWIFFSFALSSCRHSWNFWISMAYNHWSWLVHCYRRSCTSKWDSAYLDFSIFWFFHLCFIYSI